MLLVSLYSVRKQSTNSLIYTYTGYEYDDLGNITKIIYKNPDGSTNSWVQYGYDDQSQLTSVTDSVNGSWTYTYDTFGNIRSETRGNTTHTYSYGNSTWPDLLTAYDGQNIAYEGHTYNPGTGVVSGVCTSGNPISYYNGTRWTFDWKNGRELASATDGTHTITYDYDANGLRTYKIVDGVRHDYIYASGQLLRETWTQGGVSYILDFLYDQSGRPYMLNYTSNGYSTPYYYVLNLQGDVIEIVDASENAVAKYTYDAWGNVTPDTSLWLSNKNPLRYRGYYYDRESGFYYLQSRYYDPAVKRFLNADSYASTGQGFLGYNMFAYCGNNPICFSDQTGATAVDSLELGGSRERYNRRRAVEYAEEWCDQTNMDYYYYTTDCANFVSQCLAAGGIEMNDSWHSYRIGEFAWYNIISLLCYKYGFEWDISRAWRLAEDQFAYFSNPGNGYISGDVITISSPSQIPGVITESIIRPGDLLYFCNEKNEIYHAAIITKIDSNMIYYSGHTSYRRNAQLGPYMDGDTVLIIPIGY